MAKEKKKKIELKPHLDEANPYAYLLDYTADEYEILYSKLKEHPAQDEQENAIGWLCNEKYAKVDVCFLHSQIKYILDFNKLCKKGYGELKFADFTHFSYWIDKSQLHPFTIKRSTNMSDERKAALADNLRKAREAKQEA